MSGSAITKRTVYFMMIRHPLHGWQRVGNAFSTRKAAAEWLPFVRGAWRGCAAKVSQCTLVWVGGDLTLASRRVLDQKFNLDAPLAQADNRGPA